MDAVSGVESRPLMDGSGVDTSKYWLDYFGLSESPFQATARFSMYYPLPQRQNVLSYFHENCRGEDALCLVAGMLGSGKTTLLRQFLEHVDRNVMVCSIKADVASSVNTLLDAMTEDFCLPVASGRTIQSRLNKYLSALDADRSYVLVVDDAHDLPLDTLAALLHFCVAQNNKVKLRVMLFGELSLQGRIESLMNKRGKSNKIKSFHLKALSLEDTKQYLRHRFIKAGMTREMPFSVTDVARIHRLSGGLPGRINRVAQQSLIDMMKSDQHNDTVAQTYRLSMDEDGFGLRWFAVALFVALVSCSVWMFHGHVNEHVMAPIFAKKSPAAGQLKSHPMFASASHLKHDHIVHKAVLAKSMKRETEKAHVNPWVIGRVIKAVNGAVVSSVAGDRETPHKGTIENHGGDAKLIESKVAMPATGVIPVTHQKAHAHYKGSLLAGQGYSLQLLAVKHFNGLPKEMLGGRWANHVGHVNIHVNGQPWTLLLLGHFSDKQQADKALASLPPSLQHYKPWVRSFSSIRKLMVTT